MGYVCSYNELDNEYSDIPSRSPNTARGICKSVPTMASTWLGIKSKSDGGKMWT